MILDARRVKCPLARSGGARHSRPSMANSEDPQLPINPRAAAYGEALRRLRRGSGISQVEAARAAGLSQAAWTKYERGRSLAFLNLLNQEKCVKALGRTLADLEAMRQAVDGHGAFAPAPDADAGGDYGVREDGARFDPWPADGGTRTLIVTDETLSPYAEPGETVIYSLVTPPRADRGVVLKRHDGEMRVRRYIYSTPDYIVCTRFETAAVDGRDGWIECEELYPLSQVEGLYPILWRGEG